MSIGFRKPDAPPPQRLRTNFFQRGQGYSNDRPQGLYDWLLIFTVRGMGQFDYTEGQWNLQVSDVLLIEPDAPHAYRTHPEADCWDLLWAHFEPSPAWRSWLDWPTLSPGIHHMHIDDPTTAEQVRLGLERADRLFQTHGIHSLPLALNALESAILWCDQFNPRKTLAHGDARLQQVVDFINRQMHEPIGLQEMAEAAGLSASRLSHLFSQRMQITPQRYLEQQRLTRAQQLLETTQQTIGEIAEAVGYHNPFYFTNRFTRAFGQSPRAYRKRRN